MSPWAVLLVALGVSGDAFAVSLGRGLKIRHLHLSQALLIAGAFGLFQAIMPVLGWMLGSAFADQITAFDHWVAFALLTLVGGKMIWEAVKPDDPGSEGAERTVTDGADARADGPAGRSVASGSPATAVVSDSIGTRELLVLSVATSIDALAVGITLSFLDVNIWLTALVIGVTTFLLSLGGVYLGHRAGLRYRRPAEIVGGLILIAIGVKILVDHLSGG